MNDIKQRRQKNVKETRELMRSCRSDLRGKANPVKLHVTPLSMLMVQELLSLQLRFLGQRRGQAYSEGKSPSHTLCITRLTSGSDFHRKRICNLGLRFRLPSSCQLECFSRRWDHLD